MLTICPVQTRLFLIMFAIRMRGHATAAAVASAPGMKVAWPRRRGRRGSNHGWLVLLIRWQQRRHRHDYERACVAQSMRRVGRHRVPVRESVLHGDTPGRLRSTPCWVSPPSSAGCRRAPRRAARGQHRAHRPGYRDRSCGRGSTNPELGKYNRVTGPR